MQKIAILINNAAGIAPKEKDISELAASEYIALFPIEPSGDLVLMVKRIAEEGYTIIVVAGGDGTISSAVKAILELQLQDSIKLGVLPTGTFNHFARDLHIPLVLKEAFRVILSGKTMYIDLGKVNGRPFINNSSIGLYPTIVRERKEKEKRGWRKKVAFLVTFLSYLRLNPSIKVEFKGREGNIRKDAPFVFIGNNKYTFSGWAVGHREHLDEGILSISIANKVSRLQFLKLIFHTLSGNLLEQKDFTAIGLRECTIASRKSSLLVSLDGEVVSMKTPLRYTILPKILSVIVP